MKYIDADKLKRFEEMLADIIVSSQGLCTYEACKDVAKSEAPALIGSLQQEVDLEEITKFSRIKELPDGFDKDWLKYYHIDKEYNSVRFHHLSALEREYIIARHFYELGKNSKC